MTGQEYINVRDLSNVRHAIHNLIEVCLINQRNIPRSEYRMVMGKLMKWEKSLFKVISQSRKGKL